MRSLTLMIAAALAVPTVYAQAPATTPPKAAAPDKHSAHRRVTPAPGAVTKAPAPKPNATAPLKPLDKHSAHRRVAAVVPLAPVEPPHLDDERMAVVPRVMVGEIRCDSGRTISVLPHADLPGRFVLASGKEQHTVTPQPTTTGVIRLENTHTGMVWLQVPVKSMWMDAKKGQRLADNCIHPEQAAEVEAMKRAPTP